MIDEYTADKLLVIGSNQDYEYEACDNQINIENYANKQDAR